MSVRGGLGGRSAAPDRPGWVSVCHRCQGQVPPGAVGLHWPGTKRPRGCPFPIWPILGGMPGKPDPFGRQYLAAGTPGGDVVPPVSSTMGPRVRHWAFPWVPWAGSVWPGFATLWAGCRAGVGRVTSSGLPLALACLHCRCLVELPHRAACSGSFSSRGREAPALCLKPEEP